MGRVFSNVPGDLGSVPGKVIPKTLKMVLDTSLLKIRNIGYVSRVKWSYPGKRSSAFPLHLGVVVIVKWAFWSPSTMVANFTFYLLRCHCLVHLPLCYEDTLYNFSLTTVDWNDVRWILTTSESYFNLIRTSARLISWFERLVKLSGVIECLQINKLPHSKFIFLLFGVVS